LHYAFELEGGPEGAGVSSEFQAVISMKLLAGDLAVKGQPYIRDALDISANFYKRLEVLVELIHLRDNIAKFLRSIPAPHQFSFVYSSKIPSRTPPPLVAR